MKSAFRKLSRVRSLTGGTTWYLSEDCLLAAKRMMYVVEYRRFYLRDLEHIMVWPNRLWPLRFIPGVLIALLGAFLWEFADFTAGAIATSIGVAWILLEVALGPTAKSRIRITGTTVDLPLVARARRAEKVLAKIDAAVRATRGAAEQQSARATIPPLAQPALSANAEASAVASMGAATLTNGS